MHWLCKGLALCCLIAVTGCGSDIGMENEKQQDDATMADKQAVLTVDGDRFRMNGQLFDMWGIRVASGTKDDAQCRHLIDQLDEYKAHGVNAVAVYYMGCAGGYYDPFTPDGLTIDAGHEQRMKKIARACAEREMVLIAGIFYQRVDFAFTDAQAVRNAVRTVAKSLKPYRNVIINIANEQNSNQYENLAPGYSIKDPANVIELCGVVHEVDGERLAGGGGYNHDLNEAIGRSDEVDVLLFDTAGFEYDSGELYERFLAAGVTGKPMVNVELFGGITKKYERGIFDEEYKQHYFKDVDAAAKRPGLGVFFHNNPWCQSPDKPLRYDLAGQGTKADPGIRWYFEYVHDAQEIAN